MAIFKRRRQSISELRGSKGARGTKSDEPHISEQEEPYRRSARARGATRGAIRAYQSKRSHIGGVPEQEEPPKELSEHIRARGAISLCVVHSCKESLCSKPLT